MAAIRGRTLGSFGQAFTPLSVDGHHVVTPTWRTYAVAAEGRIWTIPTGARLYSMSAEGRTWAILASSRIYEIDLENRTLEVS